MNLLALDKKMMKHCWRNYKSPEHEHAKKEYLKPFAYQAEKVHELAVQGRLKPRLKGHF